MRGLGVRGRGDGHRCVVAAEEIEMSTVSTVSFVLFLTLWLVVGGVSGCSSGKTTTVTTTTVTTPLRTDPSVISPVHSQEATAPSQETKVTTTTTEKEESSPGIIGSAVGLVGAVIAFPFRVVGGVLDALF
jgi:hypothetical protein